MKELIIKVDEEKMDIEGNAPIVDRPQELVRCKDCKKRYKRSCGYFYADGRIMCDDWFCADGRKKDG